MQRRHIVALMVCLFLIVLGIILRLRVMPGVTQRSPDEEFYSQYAIDIGRGGVSMNRRLIHDYIKHRDRWMYPTPIRMGYIYPVAWLMQITGTPTMETAAYFSWFISVMTLFLAGAVALRHFGWRMAMTVLAWYAGSPLELCLARRVWQDNMVGFAGLLMIALCAEFIRAPRRTWLLPVFAVTGAASLLIKESVIILYGLCSCWLCWFLFKDQKNGRKATSFLCVSLLAAAAAAGILVMVAGDANSILQVIRGNMASVQWNDYAKQYQSGPWHYYVWSFLTMAPGATIASCAGLILLIARRVPASIGARSTALLRGMVMVAGLFMLIAIIPRDLKNIRYVSMVYGPWYLLAGFGLWETLLVIFRGGSKVVRWGGLVAGIAITVLVAVTDFYNGDVIFVQRKISDPTLHYIRKATPYRLLVPEAKKI